MPARTGLDGAVVAGAQGRDDVAALCGLSEARLDGSFEAAGLGSDVNKHTIVRVLSVWNVGDQDYRLVFLHHEYCTACFMEQRE